MNVPDQQGEMSEWLKEHAWKACLGETPTWVRIPLSPPKRPGASRSRPDRTENIVGLEPCATPSRQPRQARKGATVHGQRRAPQENLSPSPSRRRLPGSPFQQEVTMDHGEGMLAGQHY